MSQERWDEVDAWIVDRLVPDDHEVETGDLPPIAVTAPQGKLLMMLAQVIGARRILEFGTLAGYSTLWLAKALPPDGEVVTLEYDAAYAEIARRNFGAEQRIRLIVGPALETAPTLTGPFDLIFIDADKANQANYLRIALDLARPGTVIVGDNVVRDGRVVDADDTEPDIEGIREFYDLLAAEPRVTATAIQTVGAKGYDGFAVAIVDG